MKTSTIWLKGFIIIQGNLYFHIQNKNIKKIQHITSQTFFVYPQHQNVFILNRTLKKNTLMKIRGFTIRIKMKSGKHKCEDLILGMQGVAGVAVGFFNTFLF